MKNKLTPFDVFLYGTLFGFAFAFGNKLFALVNMLIKAV